MDTKIYLDNVSSDSISLSLSPIPDEQELFFYPISVGFLVTRPPYAFEQTLTNAEGYIIIFTVSGTGILNYNDVDYLLDMYSVAFIPSNAKFKFTASKNDRRWRFLYLNFNGRQAKKYYHYIMDNKKPVATIDSHENIISLLWQIINQNKTDIHELISGFSSSISIQEILYEIFKIDVPVSYNELASPGYIKEIFYYLDSRYTEKITLDTLSKQFSMSKFHISRKFKEYSGVTINDYVILKRIDRAKFLLKHTNKSVGEIAEDIGYYSSCHFVNQFKAREFITPNAYRKLVKK